MNCKLCGRKEKWLESFHDVPVSTKDVEKGDYCPTCYAKIYQKLVVDCAGCAFLEETKIYDIDGYFADLVWKCTKLNIRPDNVRGCVHRRTQEQAVKEVMISQPRSTICKYCQTLYDLNVHPNCPKCGAYPEK